MHSAPKVNDRPEVTLVSSDKLGILRARLASLKRVLIADVARDGADEHQVAIDNLVWGHAYVEAARAMRSWAAVTPQSSASEMATVAEDEAWGFMFGRDVDVRLEVAHRLAAIGDRITTAQGFADSPEHRLLRSTLTDFAEREVRPHAQAIHRDDRDIPEALISAVAGLGLFGMSIPEAYGGSQEARPDTKSMLIATEELSRASLGAAGSLMTRPEILVRALVRGGTEEQKRRWLPLIAEGSHLVAVAVTEPDYGSDVANLKCRASRLPSGDWEINGTKQWCTFAGRAELLMVLCRTSDQGHRGLSIFVLEKPAFSGHVFEHVQPGRGTLRGRAIATIGYRGMHSFELVFDRYVAPSASLLGGEGGLDRGFYLQMESFAIGRLQTAARGVGIMQAALDRAEAYTKQRRMFGRVQREFPLVQVKLGEMATRTNAARQLSYVGARQVDRGNGQTEASLAKLYASRMAESVTREAMQLHGAIGYSEESEVSRYFVDARVLSIFEGAEEVLSLRVVGRSLLGQR